MRLELDAPNIGKLEKKYLNKTIDSGFVSTFGPFVTEFEESIASYLGVKSAVSTQSGTAALHISLYELGIGQGDEVIVPALTFIATVNPIVYVGARPVFVDVDINTWNISPQAIKNYITKRTKAVIPVHLYGNPCNMEEIRKIAKDNNLFVIEDATESLGATFKGRYTATFGDLGCLSFNGNKAITTGGGGMVVGSNQKRLEHIKFLVNQARDETKGYFHPEIGFNYRMTNIEAALGLAQMKKLEDFLAMKRIFSFIYRKELKGLKELDFQNEYEGADSSCWLCCIIFKRRIDIPLLQKRLKKYGIPTRRIFPPVVEFPPYRMNMQKRFSNSYYIYDKGLCLPSSTLNSEDDIYYACKKIKELIG